MMSCIAQLRGSPLQHIFDKIALADNVQYLVRASYLEIYNEEIRDLLSKVNLSWRYVVFLYGQ